jgi:hypothetical protein
VKTKIPTGQKLIACAEAGHQQGSLSIFKYLDALIQRDEKTIVVPDALVFASAFSLENSCQKCHRL